MSAELKSRIQIPPAVKRGDVFAVRVALAHPMETGFRHDEYGRNTPYNVIHTLTCRYNGTVVLDSSFTSGIAANPSLQFYIRARESGTLTFEWRDDEGREGSASVPVNVTA